MILNDRNTPIWEAQFPLKLGYAEMTGIQKKTSQQLKSVKRNQTNVRSAQREKFTQILEREKNELLHGLGLEDQRQIDLFKNFTIADKNVQTEEPVNESTITVQCQPPPPKTFSQGVQKNLPSGIDKWVQTNHRPLYLNTDGVPKSMAKLQDLDNSLAHSPGSIPENGDYPEEAGNPILQIEDDEDGMSEDPNQGIGDLVVTPRLYSPRSEKIIITRTPRNTDIQNAVTPTKPRGSIVASSHFLGIAQAGASWGIFPNGSTEEKSTVSIGLNQTSMASQTSPTNINLQLPLDEPNQKLVRLPSRILNENYQITNNKIGTKALTEIATFFSNVLAEKTNEDLSKEKQALRMIIKQLDDFIEYNMRNLSKLDKEMLEKRRVILEKVEKKMIVFSDIQTKYYEVMYKNREKRLMSSFTQQDGMSKDGSAANGVNLPTPSNKRAQPNVISKIRAKNNQMISESNGILKKILVQVRTDGGKKEPATVVMIQNLFTIIKKMYTDYVGLATKARLEKKSFPSTPLPLHCYKYLSNKISNKSSVQKNYEKILGVIIGQSYVPSIDLFGKFLGITGSFDHQCFEIFIELIRYLLKSM